MSNRPSQPNIIEAQTTQDDSPASIQPRVAESSKGKKPGFLRALSRKKQGKASKNDTVFEPSNSVSKKQSHGVSRKKNLCGKLARSKDEPIFGSRAKTGPKTLNAKARVVEKFHGLALQSASDRAAELVIQGINSIRAETIDFFAMVLIMQDNVKMLTREAVERFFDWIPLFALFLERYMLVEEDFIFKWLENNLDPLKGPLRPSARMVMSGKIQKAIRDVQDTQESFMPQLPPGERLPKLVNAATNFTQLVDNYCILVTQNLPQIIRNNFEKSQIEKARMKTIKHVVNHVGYQDFLALYTRWMTPGDLLEWKTSVLFPCDFKFFSYSTWEKDMDVAHYQIASHFAEVLEEENKEALELNKQSKADFDRALATRQQLQPIEDTDDSVDALEEQGLEETHSDDE